MRPPDISYDKNLVRGKYRTSSVLLLTGQPGIGKTTVIKKVAATLPDFKIVGFYTEEIRVKGIRQGFELATFAGKRWVLAHVESNSSHRVGKYGVEIAAIDTAVKMTLNESRDVDLFIIDEIGKMECFSGYFVQRVSRLLESGKQVIATVALKGGSFIEAVKKRPGVTLWEIAKGNRYEMPANVVSWVRQRLT